MRPPLAPVETRGGKLTPERTRGLYINAKSLERLGPDRTDIVGDAVFVFFDPAQGGEAIMHGHTQRARNVIVTSTRETQPARSTGNKRTARCAREHTQTFQRSRHIRPCEAVVAMLALDQHLYETIGLQPGQMDARSRRTDIRYHRQLGAGAGAAIHQAVEHASPRRLSNRCRNPADRDIRVIRLMR